MVSPRVSDDRAFARLIGTLYTEVLQRRVANPNKPLNKTAHSPFEQVIGDDVKSTLDTSTNTFQWGPGGSSDEVDGTPLSVRWSFTGEWA